jgi:PAS domain S-box-containing protein
MIPVKYRTLMYDGAIGLSVIVAIAATVFCLTNGIPDVYPFLYFLPIILFVYVYPNRGILYTLLLSAAFILLVYYFGFSDPVLIAVSTAWFVIFVTIGVVTSSLARKLKKEENRYQKIFEHSQAGILTFDYTTLRITEINERCSRMLRYERDDLLAKDLSVILPDQPVREEFIEKIRQGRIGEDIELLFAAGDGTEHLFLISVTVVPDTTAICSAIDITERRLTENVIQWAKDELEERVQQRTMDLTHANEVLITEIQERKRYEEAIQLANRKLNTLSSITRHDILNQITALVMYLNLAQEISTDPVVKDHLQKIDNITQLIQKQIRFTRDYQNIGTFAPQWQDVRLTIDAAITDIQAEGVKIETGISGVEIYADMLLEKVFFNLADNALRHGGHLTYIRFSCREANGMLIITCEDDGSGIPAHAKEKIFRREYFRNTGYGLFLVTEILGITDLSIRECGEPGKGARFEISCPPGTFRYKEQ